MDRIKKAFDLAKHRYDAGANPFEEIIHTSALAIQKLSTATVCSFGTLGQKQYSVYEVAGKRSRPVLMNLMLSHEELLPAWRTLLESTDTENHRFSVDEIVATKVIYTTMMSFAACYDLWKPGSRKTPGTFLEVVLGSVFLHIAPEAARQKFIRLPNANEMVELPQTEIAEAGDLNELLGDDDNEGTNDAARAGSVSTDIVLEFTDGKSTRGIVIPAKITTRERVVQPFAHQRILDSAYGERRYISLLVCVSETQRDDKNERVNDICVPGTIKLFQQYLAKLGGIFYLDPPARYLALSQEGVINVSSVGSLLTAGFDQIVKQLQKDPAD